jgi:hypothetical protein
VRQTAKQPRVRSLARGLFLLRELKKRARSAQGRNSQGLAERTTKHQTVLEIFPHFPQHPHGDCGRANEARRRLSWGNSWALRTRRALGTTTRRSEKFLPSSSWSPPQRRSHPVQQNSRRLKLQLNTRSLAVPRACLRCSQHLQLICINVHAMIERPPVCGAADSAGGP